jgi:hypothetical protein
VALALREIFDQFHVPIEKFETDRCTKIWAFLFIWASFWRWRPFGVWNYKMSFHPKNVNGNGD